MNTIFRSSTLCSLIAIAIAGGAVAASFSVSAAGADTRSERKVVTYADLRISSPAGAAELYGRIHAAAVSVCSYFWFRSDAAERRCIQDAIANAVGDVNEPALVAACAFASGGTACEKSSRNPRGLLGGSSSKRGSSCPKSSNGQRPPYGGSPMEHLNRATTPAFGRSCAAGASGAQDQTQATNLRNVTVNAITGQYETYVANLHAGYTLHALVGLTHSQYMQAQRAATASELARMRGIPVSHIAVAIDNSSGSGVARQIQLIGPDRNTLAIVNVYCKRSMASGAPHCNLATRVMQAGNDGQSLASTLAQYPQVVQVKLRD